MHETITYQTDAYTIELSALGAAVVRLMTPDGHGRFENIVFTYEDKSRYKNNSKFPGATIGPLAGRVHPPRITQNKKTYMLNDEDAVHLHSGRDNVAFKVFEMTKKDHEVIFTLRPTHEHFPSCDLLRVIYRFHPECFTITYETYTDHDTFCNFTNHTYFNLSGGREDLLDSHTLELKASGVYALSEDHIPLKEEPLQKTWFDFNEERPLKDTLRALKSTPQKGLDHCFVLDDPARIILKCKDTGRILHITTDYPAVQVYTNNFPSSDYSEEGRPDKAHGHICFETQHPPNDMHREETPGSFQKKDTTKTYTTTYMFKEAKDDRF